jgi:hypothetical protein
VAEYTLGVLTPFVVAGAIFGVAYVVSQAASWWVSWKPRAYRDAEKRADLAASLAVAHRVVVIRAPGGLVFAYRARANRWQGDYQQAVWVVRDALDSIEKGQGRG